MPKPTASSQSVVPSYETIPYLATSEFIHIMSELRAEKVKLDNAEKKVAALKLEAGSMVAMANVKSVAFIDLKVTVAAGGTVRGKIRLDDLRDVVPAEKIAAAATSVDEEALICLGVAPHVIAGCRDADTQRAGSTRLEWMKG